MTSIAGLLTLSRVIGLSAFGFALAACVLAWFRSRRASQKGWLAAVLALLESMLILDMAFHGRWRLHNLLAGVAITSHRYGERSVPQYAALILLGSAVAAGIGLTVWHLRDRPGAAFAVCGGVLSVCCWFVEVISLHAVDGLLYRRIDGVTFVRFVWAACSLMTGAGMLWDTFSKPGRQQPIRR